MILRAAWVVPVAAPPIADGFVEFEGDRIVRVGPFRDLPARETQLLAASGQLLDLGRTLLSPGFVNPHTHLELTCYAGRFPPGPFWEWIVGLIRERARPAAAAEESFSVADGARQSIRAGVTCVGDISRSGRAWRAIRSVPIRGVAFAELISIAATPPRDPHELELRLDEVEETPLLTAGVSPHAPYTVSQAHLRAAVEIAAERRRPWTMHWCETAEEVAFLRSGRGGFAPRLEEEMRRFGLSSPLCAPMDYLRACTRGLPPGTLAHVNYIEDDEARQLADEGHTVVYCPRSHAFFGHPPHPFVLGRLPGVRVAIGTDSLASLPAGATLSPLEELQVLQRAFQAAGREPPSPGALWELVTRDAAAALGQASLVGTIEAGKQADLIAFNVPETIAGGDAAAVLGALINSSPPATAVWVAGQMVMWRERADGSAVTWA